MTAIRHSTTAMSRAVELKQAGWPSGQIPNILYRELGVRPSRNTILRWTSAQYAEKERRRMNGVNARRWVARWQFNYLERATRPCREEFIRRLDAEGVPKQSIAKVCTVLFAEPISRDKVRRIIDEAAS